MTNTGKLMWNIPTTEEVNGMETDQLVTLSKTLVEEHGCEEPTLLRVASESISLPDVALKSIVLDALSRQASRLRGVMGHIPTDMRDRIEERAARRRKNESDQGGLIE